MNATNGGRVVTNQNTFRIIIQPNDNPHGTLEFVQASFVLQEQAANLTQFAQVIRK